MLAPDPPWNPQRTWVFAIGVIRYPDGQAWPEAGRRDVALQQALLARGVPPSQVHFVTDREATRRNVTAAFERMLASAPEDATLWFYFAGHGSRNERSGLGALELYDGSWSLPALFTSLERHFRGREALLFADCCYSGCLGTEAMLRTGRVACGVLASSQSSTPSTGAWTFTDCLVAALGGQLMLSPGASAVNLLDLARHAEREMAMNHGQLATFACTNGFDPGMVLGPGARRTDARAGEYVEAKSSDGRWYPARILRSESGRVRVRWVGYGEDDDEWVADGDLRPLRPRQHPHGTRVQVKWKDEWYPAVVLTAKLGVHFVHYEGFEDFWDEWVDAGRIRVG